MNPGTELTTAELDLAVAKYKHGNIQYEIAKAEHEHANAAKELSEYVQNACYLMQRVMDDPWLNNYHERASELLRLLDDDPRQMDNTMWKVERFLNEIQ